MLKKKSVQGREKCEERKGDTEGKRWGELCLGKWEKGDGKEREDERTGRESQDEKVDGIRIGKTTNERHPLTKQTSLSGFPPSSSSVNVDILQLSLARKSRVVFPVFDKEGIMGVEVHSIQERAVL